MDSNITTLIAGIALFAFGSGPVKGFAVVLCLGILTSVFTATFVSRGLVNLIYGSRRKLDHVPIGKIWIPKLNPASGKVISNDDDVTDQDIISSKVKIAEQKKMSIKYEADQQIVSITEAENIIDNSTNSKPNEKAITKRKTSNAKQSKQQ